MKKRELETKATMPFDFCCPRCKGPLDFSAEEYLCAQCSMSYPIIMGIPDFRLFIDSYAQDAHTYKHDDYRQAVFLEDHFGELDFAGDRFNRMYANTLTMVDRGIAD